MSSGHHSTSGEESMIRSTAKMRLPSLRVFNAALALGIGGLAVIAPLWGQSVVSGGAVLSAFPLLALATAFALTSRPGDGSVPVRVIRGASYLGVIVYGTIATVLEFTTQ